MEYTILLLQSSILAILAIYFLISKCPLAKQRIKKASSAKEAPEAKGRWPVIGHLHLLGGKQILGRTLGAMADDYGSAFTLWIGQRRTLVVSNWEMAKECLTVHDKALATRPMLASGKYMCYNYSMFGLAPYGTYWREARKLATLQLLSARQLELMKHVRTTEVSLSIGGLYQLWEKNGGRPVKVEFKEWLGNLAFNNVLMMVAGKRYYGEDTEAVARSYRALVEKIFYLLGVFVPSDAIPWLEWLDIGGYIRAMKETEKELDLVVSRWIEEHHSRKSSMKTAGQQYLIDVMLSMANFPVSDRDPELIIKATAMALILTASDTTYVTMTWILALLLNNRNVLKKAQEELDNVIGKERNADESDIANLPYLQAIVKETLRLYPAGTVSLPHEATEDCNIGDFRIPTGTQVLFNLWKIQRDPTVWENPLEFNPERFLSTNKDVDFRGQHFQFIPFGAGRRMCPGITFALQVMHLTLARLLHSSDMATEDDRPVDMTEGLGLTMPKATSLPIMVSPRLSTHLYSVIN